MDNIITEFHTLQISIILIKSGKGSREAIMEGALPYIGRLLHFTGVLLVIEEGE